MAKAINPSMFQRPSLDQITEIPDSIISVYIVENHIWADGGSAEARASRHAETRTVDEFLIGPVRPFLNDVFRQMAAPYIADRKDNPIGQGYWIQAEFGSGKSHLLSFVGALALGGEAEWALVREKEIQAGLGRRESLYSFYESGLAKKTQESKGILVAVKTLVGQGSGAIGVSGTSRTLTEYVLDAVAEQFYLETGKSLPLYPTEILAERFLNTEDLERYRRDLARFLRDPTFFDQEEQEDMEQFLHDLRNNPDPGVQRDCGQRLWDFYERYLKTRPQIPMETEEVLGHMVRRLLDEGYAGLLLVLDEVSLFMKERTAAQRAEDEKALVVLANRLTRVENLPVWTICAAQQAVESMMGDAKNIIARERLDLVPLLNDPGDYYDIALSRVRTVTDPAAVDAYLEDYKRSFSWPQAEGRDRFARFFPFYPPSIDVVRAVSYNLTTLRSALYFMLQTLKTQRKRQSRELISLWSLFDDVVEYEEDPSGTTKGLASVKTKWPKAWQAYETGRRQLDTVVKGPLKVYRGRCEKILKTLFLYHVANLAPTGLGHEELMNCVMEWKDHDAGQQADLQDNLDHYEVLSDQLARELAQVTKVGQNYQFNLTGDGPDPRELFQKERDEAVQSEAVRRQAWEALLALDGWQVATRLMTLDLAPDIRSVFRELAPSSQADITVKWHGREIAGRVYMRDLLDAAAHTRLLPSINSSETGLDFAVFISSTPASEHLAQLAKAKKDPRVLFWSPDALTASEQSLLADFAAYRALVREYGPREDQQAKEVMGWVQGQLRAQMGTIHRLVRDSYGRGRMTALDHAQMPFLCQGELSAILTPLVAQVLDATYLCKEMDFGAPAPFNDTNAINVINGIVKVGEIPRGAKPNRDISAAQNYGFALGIMRRTNDRKLDLSECRYTRDMADWIAEKLGDSGATMPVATVYKNLMGIGGPNGQNYGLSRRMVQLYLLCLVREGKIRLALFGHNLPAQTIDYGNVATVDFRTAVLDAFDQVQRVKPPEGWEILAPFAAVLLEDASLRTARQDVEIQAGVQRLLDFRESGLAPFRSQRSGLAELFQEIERANPLEERLAAWEAFLASPVDTSNPLPFLRDALDQAFGYHAYRDDVVRQDEVDDLAVRCAEVRQVDRFFRHGDRVRAAARYVAAERAGELPDEPTWQEVRASLQQAHASLGRLDELILQEARLLSELLEPAEAAIRSYGVRYLQIYDQVTTHAEQVRQEIEALPSQPAFRALDRLARVAQLGADPHPELRRLCREILGEPSSLSPTLLNRDQVSRALRSAPQPAQCGLTLNNADEWQGKADSALARCQDALRAALLGKAALLHSEALRERLSHGRDEPFIAGLLEARTVEEAADYLARTLGQENIPEPDPAGLLTRYLKKLQVRKLKLADFAPPKRTIERADVEAVVAGFRAFLLEALVSGEDELLVIEME